MSLDLIRNRPQFDLEILKPGVTIKYKFKNEMFEKFTNAIIIESELEALHIIEYDTQRYCVSENKWLYLNDVLNEKLEIEILK